MQRYSKITKRKYPLDGIIQIGICKGCAYLKFEQGVACMNLFFDE